MWRLCGVSREGCSKQPTPRCSSGMLACMRSVALVGAYERDNFGDLLFREMGESALRPSGALVRATAPFPMAEGQHVRPVEVYARAGGELSVSDAVWVLGGEIGGTTLMHAYEMSAPLTAAIRGSRVWRSRKIASEVGSSAWAGAYLPRMSARTETLNARFVISSAGLSGLRGLKGRRRAESWGAVGEASSVWVRDQDSKNVLDAGGVRSRLAPDMVHALADGMVKRATPQGEGPIIFQMKGHILQDVGIDSVVDGLTGLDYLASNELVLLSAGEARGHDSVHLLNRVATRFRSRRPSVKVRVVSVASPMEKAELIANCGTWIGTSLHGIIISSSYNVPRVALELPKLVRYMDTWNDPMPKGVSVSSMVESVSQARGLVSQDIDSGRSVSIEARVRKALAESVESVLEGPVPARALSASRWSLRDDAFVLGYEYGKFAYRKSGALKRRLISNE